MRARQADPARVPGYDLGAPTESDARAALQRVFGPERGEALWSDACRVAGVPVGRVSDGTELRRAVDALAKQGGASVAVARSVEIRMRTHALLASRAAATTRAGAQP